MPVQHVGRGSPKVSGEALDHLLLFSVNLKRWQCAGSQPCDKCVETGSSFVFAVTLDRRRKYAQRLAEQKLNTAQQLLDKIIVAFDKGDSEQLRSLISTARASLRASN
jgi:hypothetical protein